ncbi:MAG: hypothetical protein U5J83_13480 [Bryobacterales bacterium]|nr:hypothetical protein [Bryobacterales bacterium]
MRREWPAKPIACAIRILLAVLLSQGIAAAAEVRPAFAVGVPSPTKDKPQSKLWFAHDSWWAWLPVAGGSSVWKRTADGWQRQGHLDAPLQGVPGQADVWADEESATAVLVAPERLAVVSLQWRQADQRYELATPPAVLRTPPLPAGESGIESATIARDGRGRWWVAHNWQRGMFVRHSTDSTVGAWSAPIAISTAKAAADDLCLIVALPGSIAVVWSDQAHDAVYFRQHDDGAPPETWKPIETASSGGKTADDHLNAAVSEDGTLYLATKNSVDALGQPQLVLRIRHPNGAWAALPYAPRTITGEPSRPIVLLAEGSQRLFLVHSVYGNDRERPRRDGIEGAHPRRDWIAWQVADRRRMDLSPAATPLLETATRLNNVTGTKALLPAGQPWIVLVSDQRGRVFEAELAERE